MARAKPCALLAPLALRYAHRVGETPASAPLRRSLPAYGGSSHSFSVVHLSGGVGLCLPRLSVLSSLPFDSILFRSYLFRAAARFIYLFGGGGFGSSSRDRRCGRRHGSRCPCLPSGGAPTPRPRSPAPFGRALPSVGLRGERLKPFLSATRSQCQTWLVSSTKPQRRGLNGSLGTLQKPCLPFLRHYRHRFCGVA